jgi:pyruvate-formate lyase-activating enzyme
MDLPDNKAFCVLPWVHLCGSVDGVWGRCCVDRTMHHDDLYSATSEPDFALKPGALGCLPHSRYAPANPESVFGLVEAFNSPNMRQTRLAMLAGQRVDACSYCYEREAGGGESYRQKALQIIGSDADVAALVAMTESDGTLASFPPYLDLRFGNACNLKCIMCGYPVSSRWGLDQHPAWAPAHIDPYRDDEQLWTVLREHAGELRRIYFAGGEPFLQQGHARMLDLLVEAGAAPHVHLAYHSNMMTLPNGIFDRLLRFRSVEIGASCDGVGPIFEKIRTGGRWDVFVRNVRAAKQYVDVWLSVAPQSDNILHLGEIIDFAVEEGLRTDLTNFVHWPKHLAVCNLPATDKVAATAYLTSLVDQCHTRGLRNEADHLHMLIDFLRSGGTQEVL